MTQGKIERYHRSVKNVVRLENYYTTWQLERAIARSVNYYKHERLHEALGNVTPNDMYYGRQRAILTRRDKIKRLTLERRNQENRSTCPPVRSRGFAGRPDASRGGWRMIETLPETVRALYPFEPHWLKLGPYSLHYADEGPRDDSAVVLLHGNPTWSFLYRDVIPPLAEAGYRVLAPDFLGSGRSDHATHEREYAIGHHIGRTLALLDAANVSRAVFFLQDWGGPIALGMCLARPSLVAGMVLGNTFWGEASDFHRTVFPWRGLHAPIAGPLIFGRQRIFIEGAKLGMPHSAHDDPVWAGYRLPYDVHPGPGATLAWPRAISLGEGHPTHPLARAIWDTMPEMNVPTRFVWGAADPVFPWTEQGEIMRARLPRGGEAEPVIVKKARHFIQEWVPQDCAEALLAVARQAFKGE